MKYLHLVWAGVWRRPGRATLTLLSIVNAFLLYGLLQGFASGISHAATEAHSDVLFTTSRVSNAETLPIALTSRFGAVPGVLAASPILPFIGYYQRPDQFVPAYGVFTADLPQVTPGMVITPAAVDALRRTRTGAVVSEETMQLHGWKVGQRIPLTSFRWLNKDGTKTWTFDIVGTYRSPTSLLLRDSLMFDYDYLDASRTNDQSTTNAFIVRVNDPAKLVQTAEAMDQLTRNSPYETKSQSESQYARDQVRSIGDVGLLANSVVGAVFFTLLFSVGGVMSQSMRERTKEIGILKAIGFGDGETLALVLAEAIVVCVGAADVGVLLSEALYPIAASLLGFTGVHQGPVLLQASAIATLLALISGLPPALRAVRLPIIEALKGEHA